MLEGALFYVTQVCWLDHLWYQRVKATAYAMCFQPSKALQVLMAARREVSCTSPLAHRLLKLQVDVECRCLHSAQSVDTLLFSIPLDSISDCRLFDLVYSAMEVKARKMFPPFFTPRLTRCLPDRRWNMDNEELEWWVSLKVLEIAVCVHGEHKPKSKSSSSPAAVSPTIADEDLVKRCLVGLDLPVDNVDASLWELVKRMLRSLNEQRLVPFFVVLQEFFDIESSGEGKSMRDFLQKLVASFQIYDLFTSRQFTWAEDADDTGGEEKLVRLKRVFQSNAVHRVRAPLNLATQLVLRGDCSRFVLQMWELSLEELGGVEEDQLAEGIQNALAVLSVALPSMKDTGPRYREELSASINELKCVAEAYHSQWLIRISQLMDLFVRSMSERQYTSLTCSLADLDRWLGMPIRKSLKAKLFEGVETRDLMSYVKASSFVFLVFTLRYSKHTHYIDCNVYYDEVGGGYHSIMLDWLAPLISGFVDVVDRTENKVRTESDIDSTKKQLRKISELLIWPLQRKHPGIFENRRHWVIIPASTPHLDRIPFVALPLEDGRLLLECVTISYSHGIGLLELQQRRTADLEKSLQVRQNAVVVANTRLDLAEADTERRALKKLLGDYSVLAPISKNDVVKEIPFKDIIHFACHATPVWILMEREETFKPPLTDLFNSLITNDDLLLCIFQFVPSQTLKQSVWRVNRRWRRVLQTDIGKQVIAAASKVGSEHLQLTSMDPCNELLFGEEISKMNLDARLTFLSCCYTAAGSWTVAGGSSLARAFEQAGVPTVLATHFSHPSYAGAFIAISFYYYFVLKGESVAEALRHAQLQYYKGTAWEEFKESEYFKELGTDVRPPLETQDPYYFAGLHILGNPSLRFQPHARHADTPKNDKDDDDVPIDEYSLF